MAATFLKRAATASSLATLTFLMSGCESPESGPQGWSDSTRAYWYEETQGSRLAPLAWFNALEQPDGTAAFADPAWLQGFCLAPG